MSNATTTKELTGAQIFMKALRAEGVDTIFDYPGAIILSIYDELYHSEDIKHYLVRHEQAAIHAAEGYARVTGKCGVVLVTSGPGATNTVTGIANAYLDGYPLVVFTGQVHTDFIGKNAFQEVDIVDIVRPCAKKSYQVRDVKDLANIIKEAFYVAQSGKKGPVLIDLPKNVLESKIEINPETITSLSFSPQNSRGINENALSEALDLLCNAKHPVILSGGGVLASEASDELTQLAQKLNIPVTTTMMGIGTYGIDDETNLGMMGQLGNYWANQAVNECDVLLAIGTRFNDRILAPIMHCSEKAKIIYIDVEPSEFSKTFWIETLIAGDAKTVLTSMLNKIEKENLQTSSKKNWINQISEWREKRIIPDVQTDKLHAHTVLECIYEYTKGYNPVVATEVGQHQLWAAQAFKITAPRKFLTSGGLGTMGFGFPAAIGACIPDKSQLVLNIAGDGSIQMNIQELATCVEYNLPVKTMILNNGYLGMVRQWQEKLYDKKYSGTKISSPDFVKVAEAYGAKGIRVEKEEEIFPALIEAIEYPGPVFIDFIIEPFEVVYPWVKG